ncbi:MAG: hypothetical protein D3903_05910 [Candidatus Electrothrix sp. GM3_4]|nr:hypothetical protein [Candidatus Electrothrix sp. GM3_4]
MVQKKGSMPNSAILNRTSNEQIFCRLLFFPRSSKSWTKNMYISNYGGEAMKKISDSRGNEEGFVLITALLVLLTLTMTGIAVNRSTMTEWRIAMNDRLYKQTFYEADAGTELASEVLEQSIACLGFDEEADGKTLDGKTPDYGVHIEEDSLGFWRNYSDQSASIMPSDDNRDLYFPANYKSGEPHTNITISGNTKMTTGAAIMMASGYEGLAKGIGTGGATLGYDINVQRVGRDGTESLICIEYNHVLGAEGDCHY